MDGAYNWWETLNAEMLELGYYRSRADPSVHSRHTDRDITITSTYTDNTTGDSSSRAEAERVKEELGWHYGVKDLGEANMILGQYFTLPRTFHPDPGGSKWNGRNLVGIQVNSNLIRSHSK